jgi:hypothetical protein
MNPLEHSTPPGPALREAPQLARRYFNPQFIGSIFDIRPRYANFLCDLESYSTGQLSINKQSLDPLFQIIFHYRSTSINKFL